MILRILIGVGIVLIVLAIFIATRPAGFHLERSISIAASVKRVFAQVDDFHAWQAWSPWEKMDPDLKRTYEGPTAGRGAVYAWSGNNKVGEGRMTIERSDEPSQLVIKLEFFRPFKATNTATFTFVSAGDSTKVTWAMDGRNGFLAKAFHLMMDMDKIVGKDFERGLSQMKAVVEVSPQ